MTSTRGIAAVGAAQVGLDPDDPAVVLRLGTCAVAVRDVVLAGLDLDRAELEVEALGTLRRFGQVEHGAFDTVCAGTAVDAGEVAAASSLDADFPPPLSLPQAAATRTNANRPKHRKRRIGRILPR